MTHDIENDLGYFEGFNFRSQSAICRPLTAQDVVSWDHDKDGEAEFWPEGSNGFVRLLTRTNCTPAELAEIDRIFSEVNEQEQELCKAVYLRSNNGLELEDITRNAIDEANLYVYGPGYFADLETEGAWDLFENMYPEAYKLTQNYSVPGLRFDEEDFLESFSTMRIQTGDYQGYLVVEIQ